MASIFILFPKDNAEYISAALQHFQWAVERFEAMSERNRLAAAARGVLHAIHVRLKKALGVSGASVIPSTSPSLPMAPSLSKETPASSASATSILDPQNSASAAGTSPSLASTSNTRNSSIFTPPGGGGGGGESSLAPSEPFFGGGPPIDPSLSGSSSTNGGGNGLAAAEQQQQQQQEATDWALPEGFDWSSIQPVYAMADVAYNDLMGISSSNGADAPAAAGGGSMPHWAGGAPLLNEAPGGDVADGGDARGWSFGGDFGNDSVWSVLNQYPTHFPG